MYKGTFVILHGISAGGDDYIESLRKQGKNSYLCGEK
jgi:hypothetical protein